MSDIHSSFVSGNRSADSAPQQLVNGNYRTVELLELIALQLGCSYSDVNEVHSSFASGNRSAGSAVQQSVNGLYRTVELLELITLKLD